MLFVSSSRDTDYMNNTYFNSFKIFNRKIFQETSNKNFHKEDYLTIDFRS